VLGQELLDLANRVRPEVKNAGGQGGIGVAGGEHVQHVLGIARPAAALPVYLIINRISELLRSHRCAD